MSDDIKLCAIVAMAENGIIGGDNKLLWHLPEDLKHFKRTTMDKPLIMGRKTFESLPGILPGRPHIIISRSASPNTKTHPQTHHVRSIEDGITLGKNLAQTAKQNEIFITGGGEIYKQTLPDIQRLYLTVVHKDFEGDTVFPKINWDNWNINSQDEHPATDDRPAFTVYILERK